MKKEKIILVILFIILVASIFVSLGLGRFTVSYDKVISLVFGVDSGASQIEKTVVIDIRFPRAIMAVFIGAGLAVSGACLQALFANPLVSPHILGVSYGAGFGAALGILLLNNSLAIQGLAVLFGIIAIMITFGISRSEKHTKLFVLVLSGVVVGALFQALISLLKYIADPLDKLPTIVYWLMGSLAGVNINNLIMGVPIIGICLILIYFVRWRLNVLSINEEEAISMGVDVKMLRVLIILVVTIITAISVSLTGIIGFVGLVIPHFARMITGSNHNILVPASMLIGGIYLLFIDTLARTISASEIPLSILTALIGAPFFAYLLRKTGGKWDD